MKAVSTKMISLFLCSLLAVSGAAVTAFALNSERQEAEPQEEQQQEEQKPETDSALSKDETVYVLAGADGSVQKIIVSDWIKNSLGSAKVKDQSELTNVENVKGEETYTMNGDNTCVWDAQGNDIYYQGDIKKELPVALSVQYQLDGKPVSAEELAGKSGRVTIRFDYQNMQYETVEIDGKKEKIYVPFAMLTGVLLNDDAFTNVEISSGKLINDGNRTIVIGMAFPGLQEDLDISKDKLEIPNYVEISADTSCFQLDMTMTLATNELFNDLDTENLDSLSNLNDSTKKLTDGMNQLLEGSSQLYDGLSTLLEKSDELVAGIDQLAAGAKSLKDGAGNLDSGAAQLQSGAAQLSEGLQTLSSNNDSLNGGAKQVFETLLSTANTQLSAAGVSAPPLTIENYAQVLNGVIASLDKNAVYEKALAQVETAVEAQRDTIAQQVQAAVMEKAKEQVTAAVEQKVAAQVAEAVRSTVAEQVIESVLQMDKASYDTAVANGQIDEKSQKAIEAAIEQKMQSEEVLAQIQAEKNRQMSSQSVQETISEQTNQQMESDAVKQTVSEQTEQQVQKIISEKMSSDEVQGQLSKAAEGAKSVITLKSSLDSYNAFYLGLQSYTAGVADAAAGAGALKKGTDDLKSGTSQLAAGSSELLEGILTMKNGTPALIEGMTQLRDGAMQLSDGLKEYNEQGIQKLADAVDGDLDGLITRFQAVRDVSLHYKNFSGANKDMDGQVKFIYRTDAIQ